MRNLLQILLCAGALSLSSCEIHDEISTSVKGKAVVHFVYHYDNGEQETLDQVESMRLFIYDGLGNLFRETIFTPEEFLQDIGAMQTYLPRGQYSFISWANVGNKTSVAPQRLTDGLLSIDPAGADMLMYGRCDSPIIKGDSLRFDIHLFKSVFKINVNVVGLDATQFPEDHYFGIINRNALTIDNRPTGEMKRYRPDLTYNAGTLSGSFYTPYFSKGDDLTIGVYCNNPNIPDKTLCETSIRGFTDFIEDAVGQDIEINVQIQIKDVGITITVSDWNGIIIQEEHLGA